MLFETKMDKGCVRFSSYDNLLFTHTKNATIKLSSTIGAAKSEIQNEIQEFQLVQTFMVFSSIYGFDRYKASVLTQKPLAVLLFAGQLLHKY